MINHFQKIKILIVEDSIFMQRMLQRMLENQQDIEVIGIAKNGLIALEMIEEHKPDIVTMDINMPRMNGLEVLKQYKGRPPCPIIVLSGYKESDVELSFTALQHGAFDFICKPSGELSLDLNTIEEEILLKIRSATNRPLAGKSVSKQISADSQNKPPIKTSLKKMKQGFIVAIGISTGGPNLLTKLIPQFPANFPAPILIAQHMPAMYTREFAIRLNQTAQMTVKEAERGEIIKPGIVYIAPGGFHMKIGSTRRIIIENKSGSPTVYIPSADILLASVAKATHGNCIGAVLTGLGNDGQKGALEIGKEGGILIAQEESTCVVPGMPKSAISTGYVDKIVAGEDVVKTILRFVNFRNDDTDT